MYDIVRGLFESEAFYLWKILSFGQKLSCFIVTELYALVFHEVI
jgi:hypothetical protein